MNSKLIKRYYDGSEYLSRLRDKAKILDELGNDEMFRVQKIMDIYSTDPIRFIEDFCLISMKEIGVIKPFFLFKYQKDIIFRLQEAELSNEETDLLIDKPRGMGLTWLLSAYIVWRWLFTPNWSAFILSRSEAEVDDGSRIPDGCIFGKVRFIIDRLPKYLIPEGYQPKTTRGTSTDMKLKIINPQMSSSINGSTTNTSAGRSRRYNLIFMDECFFIEGFQNVYRSLQTVARIKVFVSTVVESIVAEDFKKMCEAKKSYVSLNWKMHPFKDEEWFNELQEKALLLDDPDLLREAQVDYRISAKSQYYPEISQAKVEPFQYNRNLNLYCGLDFGGQQDLTVICWFQFDGTNVIVIEAYANTKRDTDWYAPFLNPEVEYNPEKYSEFQLGMLNKVRVFRKPNAYFGELDHVTKHRPTNQSDADVLSKFGIRIIYNPYAIQHEPRRKALSLLLPRMIFNKNSDFVLKCYDAIARSKYAGTARMTSEQLKPFHGKDGTADYRASCENFAACFHRVMMKQRDEINKDSFDRDFTSKMIKILRAY